MAEVPESCATNHMPDRDIPEDLALYIASYLGGEALARLEATSRRAVRSTPTRRPGKPACARAGTTRGGSTCRRLLFRRTSRPALCVGPVDGFRLL